MMIRAINLKVIFLISLIIIPVFISAQNQNSIHQIEIGDFYVNTHKNDLKYNQTLIKGGNGSNLSSRLSKTVFDYFPSWLNYDSIIQNIRFDLLTHIGIFSFDVDSSGNLKNPNSWPWKRLISLARENHVKIILTVSSLDSAIIHKILNTKGNQNRLFSNILNRIISDTLQGVNIDFENLFDSDKSVQIKDFLRNLKDTLFSVNRDLELSFTSPAVNWGNYWDFTGLAQICDYLFVTCYDYFGSWSSVTGPSSPFSGTQPFLTHNVMTTINEDYKNVDRNKLILGLPYYGNWWQTKSKEPYTPIDSISGKWIKSLYYNEIINSYSQKEKVRDSISGTPFLRWQEESNWNQIWYDDDTSIGVKYDFALQKNLKGIGIWALGFDNGRQELWNEIEEKFLIPTYADQSRVNAPTDFILYQNYPNPFNPATNIRYNLSISCKVQLKVYDLLGREISKVVDKFQQAGNYNYQFSSINLPGGKSIYQLSSGIYFYRLTAGNFSETKKMVLIR
jgi:spore germination protein YaaH